MLISLLYYIINKRKSRKYSVYFLENVCLQSIFNLTKSDILSFPSAHSAESHVDDRVYAFGRVCVVCVDSRPMLWLTLSEASAGPCWEDDLHATPAPARIC